MLNNRKSPEYYRKNGKEIHINYSRYSPELVFECIIDFKNKTAVGYTDKYFPDENSRKNFSIVLQDNKIDSFFKYAVKENLFKLEEKYETNKSVVDGDNWSIKIIYTNNTYKESYGIAKRPKNSDEIIKLFQKLLQE